MITDNVSDPSTDEHFVGYWFVPLPEPLGLKDQSIWKFSSPPDINPIVEDASDEDGSPLTASEVFVSLRIWQVSQPWRDPLELSTLIDVGRRAIQSAHGNEAETSSQAPGEEDFTIVEIASSLLPLSGAEDHTFHTELSDAFDRGLDCIRNLQRAYYTARRSPIRLATRERLPALIPYAIRRISSTSDEWWDDISFYVLHSNLHERVRDPWLDAKEETTLETALRHIEEPTAFHGYLEFQREATVALTRDGDYRSAVIFAATAAETLLDDLLMHLMWEKGTRPEDAANTFADSRRGLVSRVRSMYHEYLGGSWSLEGEGPIADWARSIADPRHRVVHAGYSPDLAEARKAMNALERLQGYVGDRLADHQTLANLPRTARIFCGEEGLRARGSWTQRVKKVTEDKSEPNWMETFARWRNAVSRLVLEIEGIATSPDPSRAWLIVVVHPDGHEDWVLHDRVTFKAARTHSAWNQIPQAQADATQSAIRALLEEGLADAVSIALASDFEHEPIESWVEEYRRVPFAGVMVNRRDLD